MKTLWDLIAPPARRPTVPARAVRKLADAPRRTPMRDKYERMTKQMLAEHGVRVRKWRTSMSGVAWAVTYRDGSVSRLIESPRPRGPMSAAIFLHEVGHHAIGLGRYRPRCLEEYHAWMYSLEQMQRWELNITDNVHARVRESLAYAVDKGTRRGLSQVPDELVAVQEPGWLDRWR